MSQNKKKRAEQLHEFIRARLGRTGSYDRSVLRQRLTKAFSDALAEGLIGPGYRFHIGAPRYDPKKFSLKGDVTISYIEGDAEIPGLEHMHNHLNLDNF